MHVHPCMNTHLPLLPPSGVFNNDSRRTVSAFLSSKLEPYTSAHGTTTAATGETGAHDASAANVCGAMHVDAHYVPDHPCQGRHVWLIAWAPAAHSLPALNGHDRWTVNQTTRKSTKCYVQLLSPTLLNMNVLHSHAVIPLKTHHPSGS